MLLHGLKTVFKQRRSTSTCVCLRRCQDRCILQWQIVLVLSFFAVLNVPSLYFYNNSHISLSNLFVDWTNKPASKHEIIFQIFAIFVDGAAVFVSVWLAAWKYKLQSIITVAACFICLGVFTDVLVSVVTAAMQASMQSLWVMVLDYLNPTLIMVGYGILFTNMLQLAMEQIPEASSAQLSALVSWFQFCNFLSSWLSASIRDLFEYCIESSTSTQTNNDLLLKLIIAIFLALFVAMYFLFKHKLLDNSPTSNTTRKLFRVLKYAYKHKFPEKRSALTYWEDKPTSRLCHGKMKYGGPFSNEEVEDVRSFIWISVLLFSFSISDLFSLTFTNAIFAEVMSVRNSSLGVIDFSENNECVRSTIISFSGSVLLWMSLSVVVYELCLVPVLSQRMPSIKCRLSFSSIATVPIFIVLTVIAVINYFSFITVNFYLLGAYICVSFTVGVFACIQFISVLEFICAQSPYTMRNFFIGMFMWVTWSCNLLSSIVLNVLELVCKSESCYFTYTIVSFCLYIFGLIFYNVCIKSYRMRSRGQEDEHQQIWVEEVYEKYVAEYSSN